MRGYKFPSALLPLLVQVLVASGFRLSAFGAVSSLSLLSSTQITDLIAGWTNESELRCRTRSPNHAGCEESTFTKTTSTIYRDGARHPRHLNARVGVLLLLK